MFRTETPPRVVVRRPRRPKSGWGTVVGMAILVGILSPIMVGLGALFYVNAAAGSADMDKTDAIVVLGAAQFNGTPSPVLETRLRHALSLYEAGVAPRIITVGGNQPGDVYTEAGAGRQWLIEHGVGQGDVIAIKAGTDTLESMQEVATLAKRNGWNSITIDSDPAHIARSAAMANRLGFAVSTNPTQSGAGSALTEEYLFRETAAYLAFEIFGQWDVDRVID